MTSTRKLAEFSISKDRFIQALACISNLADRAIVRAIVHPKDVILGFAFSNILSDDQSGDELYADYAIVKEEMIDPNFLVKSEEWPLFFVSCTEAFISSIMTLEPRENQFLKVEFYNISEEDAPEMVKSEVLVLGEHNSAVGSILRHQSSQEEDTVMEADESQSVLYG